MLPRGAPIFVLDLDDPCSLQDVFQVSLPGWNRIVSPALVRAIVGADEVSRHNDINDIIPLLGFEPV